MHTSVAHDNVARVCHHSSIDFDSIVAHIPPPHPLFSSPEIENQDFPKVFPSCFLLSTLSNMGQIHLWRWQEKKCALTTVIAEDIIFLGTLISRIATVRPPSYVLTVSFLEKNKLVDNFTTVYLDK